MGAAMVTVKCKCCGNAFEARAADRARGWGKFCSKSCKAIRQVQRGGASGPGHVGNAGRSKKYPKHDGRSPMAHKVCGTCGEPAINGARDGDQIEWYCAAHEYEARLHPFDSDALGQW